MASNQPNRRLCIALVSDFFYPALGGVELHIYQLAQGLISLGHKVIVITGTHPSRPPNANGGEPSGQPNPDPAIVLLDSVDEGKAADAADSDDDQQQLQPQQQRAGAAPVFESERQGIRYMTNGLKVFHCPHLRFHQQMSLPTIYTFFPYLRQILIRERVDIVHGHQTTSTLAHECLLHASTMGIRTVFTDHSLFGFASPADIHLNKIMKFTLADIDHVICVSNIGRENLVLRALIPPDRVSVIPNAVDVSRFVPDPAASPDFNKQINIVVLSRLVFRKGIDLLVDVIPEICRTYPQVHFIIGGSGPKRLVLDEMREKHGLQDRVEFLGPVPHDSVRDVLVRGHIFLNCSLTEAFCIAILEAVSAGLHVVSTRVGGVPEVLPESMLSFADPDPQDIVDALGSAIAQVKNIRPLELHRAVASMYSWHNVAERTLNVYRRVVQQPQRDLIHRLSALYSCGKWAGKLFCATVAMDWFVWRFLEWQFPSELIDVAPDFPQQLAEPPLEW